MHYNLQSYTFFSSSFSYIMSEAYHLEVLRKQRANDRRREWNNARKGVEKLTNTSKDLTKVILVK